MLERIFDQNSTIAESLAFSAQTIIEMLVKLAEGCPDNPAYRVKREPRCECELCEELWEIKQSVDKIAYARSSN